MVGGLSLMLSTKCGKNRVFRMEITWRDIHELLYEHVVLSNASNLSAHYLMKS